MARFFVLLCALSLTAQVANANSLHEYLKNKDADLTLFADAIRNLPDPIKSLSELDENGLTVLGEAILHGHQEIVQLLLHLGFSDLGPKYRETTLAQFAFRARQTPVHVFLAYYEHDVLNGFRVDEAIANARQQQREFNRREAEFRASLRFSIPLERVLGKGGYLTSFFFPAGLDDS